MKQINYRGINIDVLDWVNYIATDKDGSVWGYEKEPRRDSDEWYSGVVVYICGNEYWEQSLEKV